MDPQSFNGQSLTDLIQKNEVESIDELFKNHNLLNGSNSKPKSKIKQNSSVFYTLIFIAVLIVVMLTVTSILYVHFFFGKKKDSDYTLKSYQPFLEKDNVPPKLLKTNDFLDREISFGDEITFTYNELIDCTPPKKYYSYLNKSGTLFYFDQETKDIASNGLTSICNFNQISFYMNSLVDLDFLLRQNISIHVCNVSDRNGNTAKDCTKSTLFFKEFNHQSVWSQFQVFQPVNTMNRTAMIEAIRVASTCNPNDLIFQQNIESPGNLRIPIVFHPLLQTENTLVNFEFKDQTNSSSPFWCLHEMTLSLIEKRKNIQSIFQNVLTILNTLKIIEVKSVQRPNDLINLEGKLMEIEKLVNEKFIQFRIFLDIMSSHKMSLLDDEALPIFQKVLESLNITSLLNLYFKTYPNEIVFLKKENITQEKIARHLKELYLSGKLEEALKKTLKEVQTSVLLNKENQTISKIENKESGNQTKNTDLNGIFLNERVSKKLIEKKKNMLRLLDVLDSVLKHNYRLIEPLKSKTIRNSLREKTQMDHVGKLLEVYRRGRKLKGQRIKRYGEREKKGMNEELKEKNKEDNASLIKIKTEENDIVEMKRNIETSFNRLHEMLREMGDLKYIEASSGLPISKVSLSTKQKEISLNSKKTKVFLLYTIAILSVSFLSIFLTLIILLCLF